MAVLKICTGRTCSDHGSAYLFDRFKAETTDKKAEITATSCACLGQCKKAVNVKVESDNQSTIHPFVTGPKLAEIIKKIK